MKGKLLRRALVVSCVWPAAALAVDAVTGASPPSRPAGTAQAILWITGQGFTPGATVALAGGGINQIAAPVVVPEAELVDGGRGDGIRWTVSIAADALQGARDVIVTGPDGTMATGRGLFTVGAPGSMPPSQPPTQPPTAPPTGPGTVPPSEPEPIPIGVDVVSRASPTYGGQGEQVNLWIVGRTFADGTTVEFSRPGLGPAVAEGVGPLPLKIVRNVAAENGKADGIEYYLRIDPTTELGPVDITVVGPDGTRATGVGLFDIVPAGQAPPDDGMGNVDSITGASPGAFRSGRNVSLWLWGKGIASGAQLEFSQPGISPYSPYEAVEGAANYPGYDGMRAFLLVEASVPAGPVDVTVVNPNGSRATGRALVTVVGAGDPLPGSGDAIDDVGTCLPPDTTVEEITRVAPRQVAPGSPLPLAIVGRGFACGASVLLAGGGLQAPVGTAPRIVRSPNDPTQTTLYWDLDVTPDARLGPRDVTIVNPNNSSKTLRAAFEIVEVVVDAGGLDAGVGDPSAGARGGGVKACSQSGVGLGGRGGWGFAAMLAVMCAQRIQRRRRA
jgi:hypothetical protein